MQVIGFNDFFPFEIWVKIFEKQNLYFQPKYNLFVNKKD